MTNIEPRNSGKRGLARFRARIEAEYQARRSRFIKCRHCGALPVEYLASFVNWQTAIDGIYLSFRVRRWPRWAVVFGYGTTTSCAGGAGETVVRLLGSGDLRKWTLASAGIEAVVMRNRAFGGLCINPRRQHSAQRASLVAGFCESDSVTAPGIPRAIMAKPPASYAASLRSGGQVAHHVW